MYPLNLKNSSLGGYAVANDEAEHAALSDMGYEPKLEQAESTDGHTVESVRALLDSAGIAYDKRLGLAKLVALLP
jgi:hypothetical protein